MFIKTGNRGQSAREEWLELRNAGGKAVDKAKGVEKTSERDHDATDDLGKDKTRSRSRDDEIPDFDA
jgi:hypothetical protein